jgi:hypothetical protein
MMKSLAYSARLALMVGMILVLIFSFLPQLVLLSSLALAPSPELQNRTAAIKERAAELKASYNGDGSSDTSLISTTPSDTPSDTSTSTTPSDTPSDTSTSTTPSDTPSDTSTSTTPSDTPSDTSTSTTPSDTPSDTSTSTTPSDTHSDTPSDTSTSITPSDTSGGGDSSTSALDMSNSSSSGATGQGLDSSGPGIADGGTTQPSSGSDLTNNSSTVADQSGTSSQLGNETSSANSGAGSENQSSVQEVTGNPSATGSGSNNTAAREGSSNVASVLSSQQASLAKDEVSVSSASDPNSVEETISSGDGQNVNYGNVGNTNNVSSTLTLDKTSYNIGENPLITVNDTEANVDPDQVNTIVVTVNSTSDKTGIPRVLTETGKDTGIFQGSFSFTSGDSSPQDGSVKIAAGDKVGISYEGSHPRMKDVIGGVQQGGNVQMKEVTAPGKIPSKFYGKAVQVTFGDGVVLAPNSLSSKCACASGSSTVTMSYANVPLKTQDPRAFTIWQYVELPSGPGWVDLTKYQPPGTKIIVDTDAKTVTAYSPFKGGIFSIGVPASGGGGGGGGIGLPGAGIVLDLLAPVTEPEPPASPPPSTNPPTSADQSSSTPIGSSSEPDNSNNTIAQSNGQIGGGQSQPNTAVEQSGAGSAVLTGSSPGSSNKGTPFNTTIAVPGIGNVVLSFTNLGSERSFAVSVLKSLSELSALKITKSGNGQPEAVFTLDKTHYDIVGPVLNLSPADLKINGTVTVAIPYNSTMTSQSGENVRILEYTGSAWEDVTTKPPADGHIVTGSLNSLGPVVAAVKSTQSVAE